MITSLALFISAIFSHPHSYIVIYTCIFFLNITIAFFALFHHHIRRGGSKERQCAELLLTFPLHVRIMVVEKANNAQQKGTTLIWVLNPVVSIDSRK